MGFRSVYKVLQEVFPQVDSRLLRAVAIEHSKDADGAVEVVLAEVIPYLSKQPTSPDSSIESESESLLNPSEALVDSDSPVRTEDALVNSTCLDKPINGSFYGADGNGRVCGDNVNDELISLEKCEESSEVGPDMSSCVTSTTLINANDDHVQLCGNSEGEEIISLGKCRESRVKIVGSDQSSLIITPTTFKRGDTDTSGSRNGNLEADWKYLYQLVNHNINLATHGQSHLEHIQKCEESSECLDTSSYVASTSLILENDDHDQVCGNSESNEIISLGKSEDSSVKVAGSDQSSYVTSTNSKHGDVDVNGSMNGHLDSDSKVLNQPADCNISLAIHGASHLEQLSIGGSPMEMKNSLVQQAPSPTKTCVLNAPESSLQLLVVPDTPITNFEKPEPSVSSNPASKEDVYSTAMVGLEDVFTTNTMVTRSGQICSIDLLEDIIEDARSNKKILFSAMDSISSLMREVEVQEKAAEQAKVKAAQGGLDILAKVEELKEHLRRAKEANEMHAGEVYGEKAILATEVRELQSRLLSLSDERDKSIAILNEMRQTIEVRLTEAEKQMKAAEQEKQEKEELSRTSLAHQEVIMEKVVQESKILKQEAEENSKLREFLMDRGRVVDILQGEIYVICQDVKVLKEKVDQRIPLGKSLSASQTSCISASSNLSLKSMATDQLAELSENLKKTSATPSIDDQLSSGEESATDVRKALVEDGWEFFDNREFYM